MAEPAEDTEGQEGGVKRTKHRSPNYPMVGLRKAVERAKQLHDKYKRAWVPINLAQELWGYAPHGSAGNQAIAALKSYGFLEIEGDGKGRRARISDSAFRVVLGGPDRGKLLKTAVVAPPIYSELFNRFAEYEFARELMKHYLLFDRGDGTFNPEVVDGLIENFLDSLRFSGHLKDDIVETEAVAPDAAGGSSNWRQKPKIGDLVQWTSAGVEQFDEPRRVRKFSDDGEWAFSEGSATGVLVSELTIMESATPTTAGTKYGPPPVDPDYRPDPAAGTRAGSRGQFVPPARSGSASDLSDVNWGLPPLRFPLPRGNVIEIRLKSKVTAAEFDKIKKLLDLSEMSFVMSDDDRPDEADDR